MKRITALSIIALGVILVFSSCAVLDSLKAPQTKQGGIYYDAEIKPIIVPAEFPDIDVTKIAGIYPLGIITLMVSYEEAPECGFVVYTYDFYVFGVFIGIGTDNPRYWIYDESGQPCEVAEKAFEEALIAFDNTGPPPAKQNTKLIV